MPQKLGVTQISFSSPEPRIDPRLWETFFMRTWAKNLLFEPYGGCSLLMLTWMHQLEVLLIVLHENQWEDTLFQGSPELFSPSVKRRAPGSRMIKDGFNHPYSTQFDCCFPWYCIRYVLLFECFQVNFSVFRILINIFQIFFRVRFCPKFFSWFLL